MKKLVPLFFLLMVVFYTGNSQNLSLIYDGNDVPNNSAVVFSGEPSTPVIEAHMGVKNNGSGLLRVFCKKQEISLITGSVNTFCWDNCYPPNVYVSLGSLDITPGETNNAFIGEYQPLTYAGQSVLRYTFFVENNPDDSVCFRALFNAYPVGIEAYRGLATLSGPWPNPADARVTFRYDVQAGGSALLVIRDLLGSPVAVERLSGTGEVVIPARDLAEGIYFCSLEVTGRVVSTAKLVVAH